MEANKIEIKALLISLATICLIEVFARVAIPKGQYDPMVIDGMIRLLEITLIILIILIWGKGLSSIGLDPSKLAHGLKKGLIWSAGFGIITLIAFAALSLVHVDPLALIHAEVPSEIDKVIPFFLIGGVVGPIAEEIFFRGIIYGFFRKWGIAVALISSTLLFVLAHGILGSIPLPQVVGGILFAVAYEVEKNLMAPITIHVLGNMAIFGLSLIS
jgi:hypothetical protein